MAQQIALRVHHNSKPSKDSAFVCHHTSHLLLHEKDVSAHLLDMKPLVVPAVEGVRDQLPLSFQDVQRVVLSSDSSPATVIVECPHREIGGKATSFADLEKLSAYCRDNGIALHMDGARLWEALAHYTTCTTSSGEPVTRGILCGLFDSIYVSTYKGIGGLTGALLIGDADFIAEARVWQRRYGGNVYTLLPYAVSAYACFRDYLTWNDPLTEQAHDGASTMVPYSMKARLSRLKHLVALLTHHFALTPAVNEESSGVKRGLTAPLVRFDPPEPVVCLIHVYIRASVESALAAHARTKEETGVSCFARLRPAPPVMDVTGKTLPEECYFEFNLVRCYLNFKILFQSKLNYLCCNFLFIVSFS